MHEKVYVRIAGKFLLVLMAICVVKHKERMCSDPGTPRWAPVDWVSGGGEGDEVAVPLIGWTRYQVHMHAGLEYRVPGSPRWQLLLRGLSSPVSRDDGHEA